MGLVRRWVAGAVGAVGIATISTMGCASLSNLSSTGQSDAANEAATSAPEGSADVPDGAPGLRDSARTDGGDGPDTENAGETLEPHVDGGAEDVSPAPETGADAAESGPTDGGSAADTRVVEVGPSESGVDAGSWCANNAPTATFCDDFDESPLGYGWTNVSLVGSGMGGLDSQIFDSPPYGFTATVSQVDGGYSYANLQRTFGSAYANVSLTLDVRFDSATQGEDLQFLQIGFNDTPPQADSYYLQLNFGSVGVWMTEHIPSSDGGSAMYVQSDSLSLPTLGQWTTLSVQFTFGRDGGSIGSVSVLQNGVTVLQDHPVTAPTALGAPYFIVGDLYGPPGSASTSVHLDNVVIDLQ